MVIQNNKSIDELSVQTIRMLAVDAVNRAGSGHPGMPMGAAPMAYTLWSRYMTHSPSHPDWINRDRFVLSAGHGSMLLYSLLHLFGYDLPLDELKRFRQWGSRTPGHPEFGHTPGVDATTGPLGQGFGMAVGMAMAEAHMAAVYNRDHYPVIDHFTYAICGDGDMMEGVTGESASLAGHLKLGKLIVLYDSNDISLDGDLNVSFSENVLMRFASYGWHTLRVEDGNDLETIGQALSEAQADPRPTLIEVKTVIGYGSPNKSGKAGEHGSHGVPLGHEETLLTKRFFDWPAEPEFFVPEEAKPHFAALKLAGDHKETAWRKMMQSYREAYPELAAQFDTAAAGQLPEGWDSALPLYGPSDPPVATRSVSERAINAIAGTVPFLIGGAADLETSVKTNIKASHRFAAPDYSGRNVFFGVREFAMGAALNGMLLHRGVRPFCATFFVFSDYLRPAIRLASLMRLPAVYVFTHDSIAVGEDGPTHEPVEQLAALRAIPGITVLRPADANETIAAWKFAVAQSDGPCALILTRQALPILLGTAELAPAGIAQGAYVLSEGERSVPDALVIATGSEVQLALEAQQRLRERGIHVRVISMPSWERFEKQPEAYKRAVLPPEVPIRLTLEMGSTQGWREYAGDRGAMMGIDRFGASAPASVLIKEYGFTAEEVVRRVELLLK
ncbi:transketolase [Paenibacillus allorhizosphaerae]|uniref:Transketolase n=1 Tax=Paenibacillus allorhizosphaerae TaxID=2849866 RepID=A0ABM8VCU7_9BACL|nr:transketolase [Paenibacillus allorhizosphaerae]CAG7625118.1 Transketolase [Paenibacillus allorhizosphaerae]